MDTSFEIDAAFPGGNILVDGVDGDTVSLRQDRRDTAEWWFHWCFRVRGAAGRTLTFRFTDGGPVGVRGPCVSLDAGKSWHWQGTAQAGQDLFSHTFAADAAEVRFAQAVSYTESDLRAFLERHAGNPALRADELCRSRHGRPVERLRAGRLDGAPRFRVLLTCRHHCCESMASFELEGLLEGMLAADDTGAWFRQNVEALVVPFVDKDGVEEGDQGKNRRPHDHNRDYDAGLYPEIRALKDSVPAWAADGRLRVLLDLHCPWIRSGCNELIYLLGSPRPEIWTEQQRFSSILEQVQTGPLPYRAVDNMPFGQDWNVATSYAAGRTSTGWAAELPGMKLATSLELPYANAAGAEVTAASARLFGRDLAAALRRYLEAVG